ncbi:DNA cross-link repair 1A protein [Danaus plexippus plexippus]|uniref:DNA cross-link repair 1A protein n=1 Tax=Danaus plexippus plexippus TaxID=278856 RepID=A0A212FMZ6_DANPL|nr:DNA cross-link repair 1A protein [Danaus plexippus plexippus]
MNDDINDYLPSLLNPSGIKRNSALSQTQVSLSLRTGKIKLNQPLGEVPQLEETATTEPAASTMEGVSSITCNNNGQLGITPIAELNNDTPVSLNFNNIDIEVPKTNTDDNENDNNQNSLILVLLQEPIMCSDTTLLYEDNKIPIASTSSVGNFNNTIINSNNNMKIADDCKEENEAMDNVDCVIAESCQKSDESTLDVNNLSPKLKPSKRKSVSVNLEIKKQKLTHTDDGEEKLKVLILNANAIEKLSPVIIQPQNYKLVKRKIRDRSILKNKVNKPVCDTYNGKSVSGNLKQKPIDCYFTSAYHLRSYTKRLKDNVDSVNHALAVVRDEAQEMSKNLGIADLKCDIGRSLKERRNDKLPKLLPYSAPAKRDIKASMSEAPSGLSPRNRQDSLGSHSPKKNADSIQLGLGLKTKLNKAGVNRNIPHYKIVAAPIPGTHFAVDAFSYGDIPNVKHYFLTHFHSDHYSGLKKNFNKLIFSDLCISRLGVNLKCFHVINVDETIKIEGVEVTAVDANHCPGALMLVFTLPNGKTLLHTGDFRACPPMESYPVFWNKDIHTIYLDTTYCNPRYDFPTQDQSLEMALYILRQKKITLEKAGKQFSSVLIVCGTYTIGKEKFFLGLARRVGCSVWACPEKDRVLQAVEGRSFNHSQPASCQLHVVPMRDLVHEKLQTYLESLKGSFSEVVAFKPSGWENGRNSSVQKDSVTIHGIPYSEHSSFSEMIRFVKFLKPKQVVPIVDISGGIKTVQKFFPCPLVNRDDLQCQSRVTDYFTHG